jgi:hypothetical protein
MIRMPSLTDLSLNAAKMLAPKLFDSLTDMLDEIVSKTNLDYIVDDHDNSCKYNSELMILDIVLNEKPYFCDPNDYGVLVKPLKNNAVKLNRMHTFSTWVYLPEDWCEGKTLMVLI